jgi:hypothetical protein
MFIDGQRVAFVGEPWPDRAPDHTLDDVGVVVAAGNTTSHVRWATGACKGQIEEVAHRDIVPVNLSESIDAFASLVTFSAREIAETKGMDAVIDRLNREGHLASFEAIAEEALGLVATRIRSDPSILATMAQLDPDDGEELVSCATATLLRAAFGQG